MNATRTKEHLEERRKQVARDLDELKYQVEDGQVEPTTAEELRGVYEQELAEIDDALAGLVEAQVHEPENPLDTERVRGFSFRGLVGASLVLVVLTAIIVWAGSRSGSEMDTSGADTAFSSLTSEDGAINVDAITTEELEGILASFPDSAAVHLALADRYLSQGDPLGALDHYLTVSMGDASSQDRSRALAGVGYLSYVTGQYEAASEMLVQSLALNKDNAEAMLYLGYVLLDGFDDAAAAIPYFERVIAHPRTPLDIVDAASEKLVDARKRQG